MHTLRKILLVLALWLVGQSEVFAATPYESRVELSEYARAAFLSEESATPTYLPVPNVSDTEQEIIFNSIREKLDKPLRLWEVTLLNYPRLRLLRNEIYARHGKKFTSADLDSWFRSYSWYRENPAFSEQQLGKIESANAELLKRLEYAKYHRHKVLLKDLDPPGVAIKKITGKNSHISVANRTLTFLKTGKGLRLAHKESRDSNKQPAFTVFESAGMFNELPLVFIQKWRTEHQVSGSTDPVGLRVFDLDGNEVKTFPATAGNLFYNKQLNAFVSYQQGGCCGVSVGNSEILDLQGTTKFASVFGAEGYGNGSLRYVKPLWSDTIFALITNEMLPPGKLSASMENARMADRIAVLGKGGEPVLDMELPSETLDQFDDLRHLVQLTPEVLYVMGGQERDEKQMLIYLNKPLPQKISIGNLYRPAAQEVTAANNGMRPALSSRLQAIRNPVVLWSISKKQREDTAFGMQEVYTLASGTEYDNAIFSAYDKLTGVKRFSYQLPDSKRVHHTYAVTANRLFYVPYSLQETLRIYELKTGKAVTYAPLNVSEPGYLHVSERLLVALDTRRVLLFSLYESGVGRPGSDIRYLMLLQVFDDAGKKLWEHRVPINTSTKKQTYYIGHRAGMIYFFDEEKITALNTENGSQLEDAVPLKFKENAISGHLPVSSNTFQWSFDHNGWVDSFQNEDGWGIAENTVCSSSQGKNDFVYLGGNRLEAVNACDYHASIADTAVSTGGVGKTKIKKDVGELEREWSFLPRIKKEENSGQRRFQILHVDNNYLFVDGEDRFWAVGEEALKDQLQRSAGLPELPTN